MAVSGLVAGIGFRAGATADEIVALVHAALAAVGRKPEELRLLATLDKKASAPVLYEAAERLGCGIESVSAEELERVARRQSERVRAAVGTGSVAEAAALRHGKLLGERRASACITCAISEMEISAC
jgi:cobalamin biosynthesis protein CbiG